MLTERYSEKYIFEHLIDCENYCPFPKAIDREAWESLFSCSENERRKTWLLAKASEIKTLPWPRLPAVLYMDFHRTGNRTPYQESYFERRRRLGILTLAECIQKKSVFLDDIINGLWEIINENTWCIPPHLLHYDDDPFPEYRKEQVDLFSAETALVTALPYYLLKDDLMKVSPRFCGSIKSVLFDRTVNPVLERDDFWWLSGRNNWTPWIMSNVIGTAAIVLRDKALLAKLIRKLSVSIDRFIDNYGEDGGCSEGPAYWNHAPASMLCFLETLRELTNGAIDIYSETKIAAMGNYIVNMHILAAGISPIFRIHLRVSR